MLKTEYRLKMKTWYIISLFLIMAQIAIGQEYRLGVNYSIPVKGKLEYAASGELRNKSDKNEQTVLSKIQLEYKPFKFASIGGSARCAAEHEGYGQGIDELTYRLSAQAKLKTKTWIDDVSVSYRLKYDHDFDDKNPGMIRNKFIVHYKVNSRSKTHCSYETYYSPYRKETRANRYSIGSKWKLWGKTLGLELSKEIVRRHEIVKSSTIVSVQIGL